MAKDLEAKPIGNDMWSLVDLLQRRVGNIVQTSGGFIIEHDAAGLLLESIADRTRRSPRR